MVISKCLKSAPVLISFKDKRRRSGCMCFLNSYDAINFKHQCEEVIAIVEQSAVRNTNIIKGKPNLNEN